MLGVSELKMRIDVALDSVISHDSMGRLSDLDRAGCDVALLKLASPSAAAAALGQLRKRGGDARLNEEGDAFPEGAPPLPDEPGASSTDPRVVAMTVSRGGEVPADEEAAQLACAGECYLLGVHRLQLAMIHSSHSVRLRGSVKPLMPLQQARNEQLHAAKAEVYRRKLKMRERHETLVRKRDEGGSRVGALKAFTKRDLVFAFRTWRVSAQRMHAVCAVHGLCVHGVCARCVCTVCVHGVCARCVCSGCVLGVCTVWRVRTMPAR